MEGRREAGREGRALRAAALLAAVLVGFGTRALGFEFTLPDDGSVVFAMGDAWYHVHRALFSFHHWPSYLTFDPCLNHPDGAPVPYPPLWDLALAGVARAAGGSTAAFERVAAWAPPATGALAALPVYALGRRLRGPGVGLGAAALYALLPAAIAQARVGNADHHAAVALLGAILLALYAAALDERTRGGALAAVFAGLALARAGLALVWQGSLLYLAPGEIALAVFLLARGERLLPLALSALATAPLLAPFVHAAATPLAGPYSTAELSRLHPLAFLAEGALVGGAWAWERWRPSGAPARRLARGAALAAGLGAAALLALPELRRGLEPGPLFVVQADDYGTQAAEQMPLLWEGGRTSLAAGVRRLGGFVLLMPLVPLGFLARRPSGAPPGAAAILLFGWTLLAGALAFEQVRYLNDYAPAGCVGFAVLLDLARARLARARAGLAGPLALAAGAALCAPAVASFHAPLAASSWRHLAGRAPPGDRALLSIEGTQMRFAEAVRAATPETPGCHASRERPAYAILAHPAIGHVLHHTARRATPADNFGPYIGAENYAAVRRFFTEAGEAEALAIAERLGAPYVVTAADLDPPRGSAGERLHHFDGSAGPDAPHWGSFRLLAEGPAGGLSLLWLFRGAAGPAIPYKLFEIVPGALLEVPAAEGTPVRAVLRLAAPGGRPFAWEARGRAGPDGLARLRLPYATEAGAPTRALGPFRVAAGPQRWSVEVPELAVREGRVLRVGAAP